MKLISAGRWGLLWLTFNSAAFASTLTIQSQTFNIEQGGQFAAFLNGDEDNQFYIYCVDYRNFVAPPQTFDANISTVPNVGNTRYGTTASGSFSTAVTAPIGYSNAANRYLLAGWLTTQYIFGPGQNLGSRDIGIQNAIWTLLDVDGSIHSHGDESQWLSSAETWESHQTTNQLAAFASHVVIFTSENVAQAYGAGRYTTGVQEMIGVTNAVPEPMTFFLLGGGLSALGVIRRRKKQ
jgi:hypothetical protein